MYKASLMLELNKSQRVNTKEGQMSRARDCAKTEVYPTKEGEMSRARDCAKTEVYPKKKDEVETSTSAEMNFSATKSNCIYKRWNNPLIAERLRTEPDA